MKYAWYISIVEFHAKTIVQGIIVKGNLKGRNQNSSNIVLHLFTVIESYFKTTEKNSKFEFYLNGDIYLIQTNKHGSFNVEINKIFNEKPNIEIKQDGRTIECNYESLDYFPYRSSTLDIISDIDDTIYISNTASFFKRIKTLSFIPSSKRKMIDFTQKLFSIINMGDPNLYFVSKSEFNLAPIILQILQLNKVPNGTLFLTPFLNFNQLITTKKDSNFKIETITSIMNQSDPNKRYILFGDDTQRDMAVYEQIARSFKNRIARIYIHQTKMNVRKRKLNLWNKLKTTFPNSVYFNKNTDIEKELELLNELISIKN